MSLKERVTNVLSLPDLNTHLINQLLQDLANARETDALIRVWDVRGNTQISYETMHAMEQLHRLGKGKIPRGTIIMPLDRPRLPAPRRLHKIFKGYTLRERSDEAKKYVTEATKYVLEHPNFKTLKRSDQIIELKHNLRVPNNTARGLVTKLKQKNIIN